MKYIIVFEDGEIFQSETITEDDISACDNDLIEIVDTTTSKQYYDNKWHYINVWEETS